MARRRRHRNPHRRSSRRHKNPHRRSSRRHRNPFAMPSASAWKDVAGAILWPLGAYAAAKFGQRITDRFLPANTPARPIVSAAIPGLAAWGLVRMFVKADKARHYAEAGALLGFGEALASATGVGPALGIGPSVVVLAPSSSSGGVGALLVDGQGNMGAALEASLDDPYQQGY